VSNTAKRVENASGTFRRQWHSVRTESSISGVYKGSKQKVSSTIGLLSVSYAIVMNGPVKHLLEDNFLFDAVANSVL